MGIVHGKRVLVLFPDPGGDDGGNCWTITRSCIMTADPDMEYAKVYCDHFTVKHNDNELYYDELTLSRIEAYIDPFGECMVREVAVN